MGSLSPQYLAEVARRREAAAAKAAAACSTDGMWSARASASAAPFVLDTRDAAELTAAEVRSEFLAKFRPLVVTGATASSWVSPEGMSTEGEAEAPWTLDWLVAHVGSKQVAVNVAGSQTTSCTEGVDVMPFRELAARLRAGEVLYLYDMSIPLKLPTLTEHLGVPAIYAHDWMQRTRELHAFSRSWPSLFVGAPGTRSSLHTDQWRGHFWMAQIQGTKRWTIFHPDDAWCLEPTWPESEPHLEPRFPDLDEMQAEPGRYPHLGLARRVDVLLRPGMLLLVPGGAPHRVVNGDGAISIAIAGNFVEASNAAAAISDLELMARRRAEGPPDRGAAAAAAALAELDICDEDNAPCSAAFPPHRCVVPWAEYARGGGAEWARAAASEVAADAASAGACGSDRDGEGAAGIVPLASVDDSSSEDDQVFWRSDGEYESASD